MRLPPLTISTILYIITLHFENFLWEEFNMESIKVSQAEEGKAVERLNLAHEDCSGGEFNLCSIKATLGESTDSSEVEELVELECESCGKKLWFQKRTGDTAVLLNTAKEGRQSELTVYEGRKKPLKYREFDNIIGEPVQVNLISEGEARNELIIENSISGGEVSMENISSVVKVVKDLIKSLYSQGENFWSKAEKSEITGMSQEGIMVKVQVRIELETKVQKRMEVIVDTSEEEPEIKSFDVNPK